MPVTPLLRASIVAAAVLCQAAPAAAGPVVSTEALAYSGTITPVNSSGAATGSAIAVPSRDLSLFVSSGYPGVSDANFIVTRFSSPGSNVNFGFLQIGDADGNTDTSVIGGFDPSLTTFYLGVDGQNATAAADNARLGITDVQADSAGTFLNYSLRVTFTGLNGGPDPDFAGYNSAAGQVPGGASGRFTGLFSAGGQLYAVDFAISGPSSGANPLQDAYSSNAIFAAPPFAPDGSPIPEPATLVTLGALGCLAAGWRRRSKSGAALPVPE